MERAEWLLIMNVKCKLLAMADGFTGAREHLKKLCCAEGCSFAFKTVPELLGSAARSCLVIPEKSLPTFRLDLGSAAVNEQFDPRDETGVIRREKRHLSNLLGFPHASHGNCGHNPRNDVCRLPTR
jgi:hypothetical protein